MGFPRRTGILVRKSLPDRIIIYRKPLERISTNLQELKENIRQTVIHEIGHYFGFDEEELRSLRKGRVFIRSHRDQRA